MTEGELRVITALHEIVAANQQYTTWTISTPHLLMLVKQAVEAEREACAKVCESMRDEDGYEVWGVECAAAIRARSNK